MAYLFLSGLKKTMGKDLPLKKRRVIEEVVVAKALKFIWRTAPPKDTNGSHSGRSDKRANQRPTKETKERKEL